MWSADPLRRIRSFAEWLLPAAAIALLPKCPVCVVALVALLTGSGLSLAAAGALRSAVLWVSIVTLVLVAVRHLRRREPVRRFFRLA